MKPREASHQGPPPTDPAQLAEFPTRTLTATKHWFRCHRTAHGPWHFAAVPRRGGGGRWDLAPPDGTCYLAATAEASVREVFGPELAELGFLPAGALRDRAVSTVKLPASVRTADLLAPGVAAFGVTSELSGAVPYALSQQWAAAFHASGRGGIHSGLRFAANTRGAAIFGPAGPASPQPPTITTVPALAVAKRAGIRALDPPQLDQLTVLPAP